MFVRILAFCLFAALAALSPRADDALVVGVMNDQYLAPTPMSPGRAGPQ